MSLFCPQVHFFFWRKPNVSVLVKIFVNYFDFELKDEEPLIIVYSMNIRYDGFYYYKLVSFDYFGCDWLILFLFEVDNLFLNYVMVRFFFYICIYIYMCVCIYIYIYIYIKRERERESYTPNYEITQNHSLHPICISLIQKFAKTTVLFVKLWFSITFMLALFHDKFVVNSMILFLCILWDLL